MHLSIDPYFICFASFLFRPYFQELHSILDHTPCQGRLEEKWSPRRLIVHSSVSLLDMNVSIYFSTLICSVSQDLDHLNSQVMSQLQATSRNQSCIRKVQIGDSWNNNMYIESAGQPVFSIKLFFRLDAQFNQLIVEIFAWPLNKNSHDSHDSHDDYNSYNGYGGCSGFNSFEGHNGSAATIITTATTATIATTAITGLWSSIIFPRSFTNFTTYLFIPLKKRFG